LYAHDISAARLQQAEARATRAGAQIEFLAPGSWRDLKGRCDLVLVDAPCSGSGSWRRDPEAKWRLTPERLAELTALQDRVLAEAREALAPGGQLVYATCSLLALENTRRARAFQTAHPELAPIAETHLSTLLDGDGFYTLSLA
ncbi:MAG: RsmB/NOP family class I SAM-dependent RNA methyltransferase, partial [Pseudomonadota bacterium]